MFTAICAIMAQNCKSSKYVEMLDFLAMNPSKVKQIITILLLWSSAQFFPIITPQYLILCLNYNCHILPYPRCRYLDSTQIFGDITTPNSLVSLPPSQTGLHISIRLECTRLFQCSDIRGMKLVWSSNIKFYFVHIGKWQCSLTEETYLIKEVKKVK